MDARHSQSERLKSPPYRVDHRAIAQGTLYHTHYILYTIRTWRATGPGWRADSVSVSGSEFYRLFVFELSASTFRRAEAEVVPIELEFDMGHVQDCLRRLWRR